MSIPISCPSCHTKVLVPDDAAGKRGKCAKCGAVVQVPTPATPEPSDPPLVSCSKCHGQFPYAEVIEFAGVMTCKECHTEMKMRQAVVPTPASTQVTGDSYPGTATCPVCGGIFPVSSMVAGGTCASCARRSDVTEFGSKRPSRALAAMMSQYGKRRASGGAEPPSEAWNWADKLLWLAFSFAKYISALVVLGCFLVIAGAALMLVLVAPKKPTTVVPPPSSPTVAAYQESLRPHSDPQNEITSDASAPSMPRTTVDPNDQRLFAVLREALLTASFSSISRSGDWQSMNSDERARFAGELEKFFQGAKKQKIPITPEMLGWFQTAYVADMDFRDIAVQRRDAEEFHAKEEAAQRRMFYLSLAAWAFLGLLSFLFLPLLIQIERNTRRNEH